ncbi:MAG: AAA family ATPase, partial [Acidimicrobiales bacterium]
ARIADVVPLDADPADLDEAVRRASEGLEPRWAPPPVDLPAAGGARGRVITVFSTKGGAGTSFLATNLAVALARRSDRPVVLVDADLQFGDVAVMLRLTPSHTVLNAVDEIASLDAAGMRSLLVRHPPSGLLALLAPVEPSYAEEVVPARMLQVVEVLASFASHVVIDTASRLDDLERELLSHADDIVLLAGMDLPSIKNLQIGVKALRNRGIPDSKTRLVLNRANSNVRLDVAAVERQLNMQADVLIPSDVVVPRSINLMEPVVLSAPRSKVARAVERLAGRFVAAPVEGTP